MEGCGRNYIMTAARNKPFLSGRDLTRENEARMWVITGACQLVQSCSHIVEVMMTNWQFLCQHFEKYTRCTTYESIYILLLHIVFKMIYLKPHMWHYLFTLWITNTLDEIQDYSYQWYLLLEYFSYYTTRLLSVGNTLHIEHLAALTKVIATNNIMSGPTSICRIMMWISHWPLFEQADMIVSKKYPSIEKTPGILLYINLHFHPALLPSLFCPVAVNPQLLWEGVGTIRNRQAEQLGLYSRF